MQFYVDASALVAVIAEEPNGQRVYDILQAAERPPVITDFCRAESSAALARLTRTGAVPESEIENLYLTLDQWMLQASEAVEIRSADITVATGLVRDPGMALRAPDAIHIATAARLGATLLTLDKGMARAAAALGLPHLNPAKADAPGIPKD